MTVLTGFSSALILLAMAQVETTVEETTIVTEFDTECETVEIETVETEVVEES